MDSKATTLKAWRHTPTGSTQVEVDVPADRSARVIIARTTHPLTGRESSEIMRAARFLTEEPHAVSCETETGFTVSK